MARSPVHPLPLRGLPLKGKQGIGTGTLLNHTLLITFRRFPPLVAVATTLSAGKRVTGFSVAYGSLRIQFPCHPVGSMSYDIEKEIP